MIHLLLQNRCSSDAFSKNCTGLPERDTSRYGKYISRAQTPGCRPGIGVRVNRLFVQARASNSGGRVLSIRGNFDRLRNTGRGRSTASPSVLLNSTYVSSGIKTSDLFVVSKTTATCPPLIRSARLPSSPRNLSMASTSRQVSYSWG